MMQVKGSAYAYVGFYSLAIASFEPYWNLDFENPFVHYFFEEKRLKIIAKAQR